MMNYTILNFVILNISFIVIQQTYGNLECQSDSECLGGASDRCVRCANTCPLSCDHPEAITDVLCLQDCHLHYCECKPGYYRRYDGKCVIRSQCYKKKLRAKLQLMYGFNSLPKLKSYESIIDAASVIRE